MTTSAESTSSAGPRRGVSLGAKALVGAGVLGGVALAAISHFDDNSTGALRLGGRFHVVVVHFPVALLMVAALAELIGRLSREDFWQRAGREILALGCASAWIAAGSGWANAHYEAHGGSLEELLFWHRWCGVGVAVLALAAIWLSARNAGGYLLTLLATAALTGWVGHLGGALVYGEDYFTRIFEEEPSLPANVAEEVAEPEATEPQLVATQAGAENGAQGSESDAAEEVASESAEPPVTYADVKAILDAHCVDCHGPRRQKGKLRLDAPAWLFAEREYPTVVPGDLEKSELFYRVTLPEDDEAFMPQEEAPLSAEQIETLKKWILAGALVPQ